MKILGITNLVSRKDKNLGLFFFDFDNINFEYVYEEAYFLSKTFMIDIYILKSSKNSYHFISFDILKKEEISKIQSYITIESDYLNIDELACNFYNILRLGEKGNKESPKFVKVFYAKNNDRLKSLGHYKIYKVYCNIPDIPIKLCKNFINTYIDLVFYNSNKTQRRLKNKCLEMKMI